LGTADLVQYPRRVPFRFYAHLSWTTWARLPLIDEQVVNFLGPFLLAEAKRLGHASLRLAS